MSIRLKIALLTILLAGSLLALALAVDARLVGPWIATLVPDPDAAQLVTLSHGAMARRLALVWMAVVAWFLSYRLADRTLGRPLHRLAAEVSRRRVSGPAWARATPQRIDEIGVIAREFGQTYDELVALRGSAARADALAKQLDHLGGIDFAVRRLAVTARRLGVAAGSGEDRLQRRLQAFSREVLALRELTRDAGHGVANAPGPAPAFTPGSAPAPESPATPDASPPGRLPEAAPG